MTAYSRSRRRARAIATGLTALASAFGVSTIPTAATAAPALMAQSPSAFNSSDTTTLERAFSGAKFTGASRVRGLVLYDNGFSWSSTDAFVSNVTGHGLAPYLTLTYRPIAWGGTRTVNQTDFTNLCSSAASRYGSQVNDYGIFNEPNNFPLHWSDGDHVAHAIDYGSLYRACYTAIKAANPSARVYIGELANGPSTTNLCNYLGNAVNAAMTRADGVAIHPYQFDLAPGSPMPGQPCRGIGRLSDWTSALPGMTNLRTPGGATVPLAITEFGYCASATAEPCSGGGAPTTEVARASWLSSALNAASSAGATIFAQYHLVNDDNPASDWNTGIMGTDGTVRDQMGSLRAFSGATWGAPGVTTGGVAQGGSITTRLNGQVDPHGFKGTSYHVQYGTSSSSLTGATGAQDAGAGTVAGPVEVTITGLQPGTVYHYRLVATGPGGTTVGTTQSFRTWDSPEYMSVTTTVSGGTIGYVQPSPFSASGWSPIINNPGRLRLTTTAGGTSVVAATSDPDGNGAGPSYAQEEPFSASGWNINANNISDFAVTSTVAGNYTIAGIDAGTNIAYAQDSPFGATWFPIANDIRRVALTSPKTGGSIAAIIDRSTGIAYTELSPFGGSGWSAVANDVDDVALTSPRDAPPVLGIIDRSTHIAYVQSYPFSPGGWIPIANNVQQLVLARAGDGRARVAIVQSDHKVSIETGSFSPSGWTEVAPASMGVTKVALSGDTIAVIRDAGSSNHVAAYQREPFSTSSWTDVANLAVDIQLSEGTP